jgi:hypothetical protein
MGIDHGSLFQTSDRKAIRGGQIDYEYFEREGEDPTAMEMALIRPLKDVVSRLEFLEFSLVHVRREYDAVAKNWLEQLRAMADDEDATWALMQPVVGTQYRVLHTLRTTEFRVPMGFNTPVTSDHWLSCRSLEIRRSILAVLASLILDIQTCCTLMSYCGRGRIFWRAMKLLHGSEDRQAFKCRAANWSPELIDAVDFY